MEKYRYFREELKKKLFDMLMMDRFGWELNIGGEEFIVESAITKEEYTDKVKLVERAIRHMLYELDLYTFTVEEQVAESGQITYANIPTIFCLLNTSIEFDDTPIKEEDVYEVEESQRTLPLEYYGEPDVQTN